MRTESYEAWLESLTSAELAKLLVEYGFNNLRQAYNDTIKQLNKDFTETTNEQRYNNK